MKISKEKLKEILDSDEIQKLIYGELNRGHSIELKVEKNNFVVVYIPRKAMIKVSLEDKNS